MRHIELNDNLISIDYPNFLCFSFNPLKIKIKIRRRYPYNIKKARFTFMIRQTNELEYVDIRDFYDNNCEIDFSYYITNELKNWLPKNTSIEVAANITLFDENNEIAFFDFDFMAIFGAINPGEIFNPNRKITWFKNFPFTVSAYVPADTTFKTSYDNSGYVTQTPIELHRIYTFNPALLVPNAQKTATLKFGGVSSTFDYTFDYTFRAVESQIDLKINLEINECTNGIYLKWLDRHGFWQYYLFDKVTETVTNSNDGEQIKQEFLAFGNYFNEIFQQNKKEAREIALQVPLADKETYKMLTSIVGSPLVYMYVADSNDFAFVPVTVKNGSQNIGSQHLQDFDLTIKLPDNQVQKL